MNYLKSFVKNGLIVLGLFLLSQISMTVFSTFKLIALSNGSNLLTSTEVIICIVVMLVTIVLLVWLAHKLGLWEFNRDWLTKDNLVRIFVSFVVLRIVAIAGTWLLQLESGAETTANDATIYELFTGENPLLIFLLIALSAPIMEEIVFRGGLIGLLFKQQPVLGMVVSSVAFGMLHTPTEWISFLLYTSMGGIFAWSYYKTKRLEVTIAIHFLNNFLPAIALMFL